MKARQILVRGDKVTASPASACWMVVDDNEEMREFIAGLLELFGVARVERFASAQEALDAFRAQPRRFEFVITDLEMPGMNGIELCRRLRAISPELKVVLASGNHAANAPGARRSGFFGFLGKPFPARAISQLLETAGLLRNPLSEKSS